MNAKEKAKEKAKEEKQRNEEKEKQRKEKEKQMKEKEKQRKEKEKAGQKEKQADKPTKKLTVDTLIPSCERPPLFSSLHAHFSLSSRFRSLHLHKAFQGVGGFRSEFSESSSS